MRATDNRRHVGEFLKETKTHLSVHDWRIDGIDALWRANVKHPHGGSIVTYRIPLNMY